MSLADCKVRCRQLIVRRGVVSVSENGMTTKLFKRLWCYLPARSVKIYLARVHEYCYFGEYVHYFIVIKQRNGTCSGERYVWLHCKLLV